MSKRLSGAEWAAELERRNAEYAANPQTCEEAHPHREMPETPPQAATPVTPLHPKPKLKKREYVVPHPKETAEVRATRKRKGIKQMDAILSRLRNSEHVERDGSGEKYNVRNVGQAVSQLRTLGWIIHNKLKEGTDVFEYYYMAPEDIAKCESAQQRDAHE